jgi:hypothetical protein
MLATELQSVVSLTLRPALILHNLDSLPLLTVSSTFGSLGTFWGIKLKAGYPGTLIDHKFLLNHKSRYVRAAATYDPASRRLCSEININAAGISVGAAVRRTAEGTDAVARARFEWASGSVEVKGNREGKALATAEVTVSAGTTFSVWAGYHFAKNWLKPLFGARITVGSP